MNGEKEWKIKGMVGERGTLFLSGLMSLSFVAAIIHATQGVMLSYYIADYGLESSAQGYPGSIQSIGLSLSIVLSAFITRRFKKTQALIVMAMLMSLSLVCIGLHPSFWLLCGCYMLFGLSYGSEDALAMSLLSDLYPKRSANMMSLVRATYSLGGMLAPIALNALLRRGMVWNHVALIAGGVAVLIFLFYTCIASPSIPRHEMKQQHRDKISFSTIIRYMQRPGAICTILFSFLYGMHQIGLTVWIVRYATAYMLNPDWGQYTLTAFWIGALLARLTLPRWIPTHRTHLLYGSILSFVFLTAGILLQNGAVLCIIMVFAGYAEGTCMPMLADHACQIDRNNSTVASSILIMVSNIGGMLAPSLMGWLISSFSPLIGMSILPLSSLLCAFLAFVMFRTKKMYL